MAWYYGTFACGHESRVNIIGPTKDRQRKADWRFSQLCQECAKKAREEERRIANEKAAKRAEEMGLPELEGTEKQVAWANTLRDEFINRYIESVEKIEELRNNHPKKYKKSNVTLEQFQMAFDYIIENKVKASYWIENRSEDAERIIIDQALNMPSKEEIEKEEELKKLYEESVVFPENKITDAVAKISVLTDRVTVEFERNEEFRSIVKELEYSWNYNDEVWEKMIKETTGTAEERAAELGNKLLNAGFPISILDEEIRKNAIEGNYEPETDRWIYRIKGEDKLKIKWRGYDGELYRLAKSLPGAKWDGGMVVNVAHYIEVEDFARLYDFRFTNAALSAVALYKKSLANTNTVKPAEVKVVDKTDGLKDILESSGEILDDLIDKD